MRRGRRSAFRKKRLELSEPLVDAESCLLKICRVKGVTTLKGLSSQLVQLKYPLLPAQKSGGVRNFPKGWEFVEQIRQCEEVLILAVQRERVHLGSEG
jgi:hypothetical protein